MAIIGFPLVLVTCRCRWILIITFSWQGCPDWMNSKGFIVQMTLRCPDDLTLLMMRLLSSNARECKQLWKSALPSQPNHVGIHRKALIQFYQLSTRVPGFKSFFSVFLHRFVLAKLAPGSVRVKGWSTHSHSHWAISDFIFSFIAQIQFKVEHLVSVQWGIQRVLWNSLWGN